MGDLELIKSTVKEIGAVDGVSPAEILDLPAPLNMLVSTILRRRSMTVEQIGDYLEVPHAEAREIAVALADKGYLNAQDGQSGTVYRVRLAHL